MAHLSSDRFFKYLLHGYSRRAVPLVAGLVMMLWLRAVGWPWWAWLPAVILTMIVAYTTMLGAVYGYQKLTYPHRAQLMKQQLRQANDDQRPASSDTDRPHPGL